MHILQIEDAMIAQALNKLYFELIRSYKEVCIFHCMSNNVSLVIV